MYNHYLEHDMKVLTVLHSLASTDPVHAKTPAELAWYLKMPEENVLQTLKKLDKEGYVKSEEGRYYMTMVGSLRVTASFS
jgi:DNA-binding IscR family transcriptional regulator